MVLKIIVLIFYYDLANKTQNYEDYQIDGDCDFAGTNNDCYSDADCTGSQSPSGDQCNQCRRVNKDRHDPESRCLRTSTFKLEHCAKKCAPRLPTLCTLHEQNCETDNDCRRTPSSDSQFVPTTIETCTKCKYLGLPSRGCTVGTPGCAPIFQCRQLN